MASYILTCFNTSGQCIQIAVSVDMNNPEASSAVECCTKASARMYWKRVLKEFDVDSVGNVKKLAGILHIK